MPRTSSRRCAVRSNSLKMFSNGHEGTPLRSKRPIFPCPKEPGPSPREAPALETRTPGSVQLRHARLPRRTAALMRRTIAVRQLSTDLRFIDQTCDLSSCNRVDRLSAKGRISISFYKPACFAPISIALLVGREEFFGISLNAPADNALPLFVTVPRFVAPRDLTKLSFAIPLAAQPL